MDEKKFSIILPVFNGEKYVNRAIKSVLSQNYNNWELIVVNDGSTDNSLNVINSIKSSKIVVICKNNTGVSETRNLGIEKSQGDYLIFLDADDWLESGCLYNMNEAINNSSADLFIFNYNYVGSSGVRKAKEITVTKEDRVPISSIITASVGLYQWKNEAWYGNLRSVWGKSFKREIIINNSIRFVNNLKIGEDMIFVLEYLIHSNKVFFSNEIVYNYFHNIDSVMNSRKWTDLSQGKLYFSEVEKLISNQVSESTKADLWLETAESDWMTIVFSENSILKKYKIMKKIMSDEYYIRFAENGLDSNVKQKIYAFVIKHKQAILLMLLTYLRMKKQEIRLRKNT